MADFDARRLQSRVLTLTPPSGQWTELAKPDPTRVRLHVTGVPPYQIATGPDVDKIFAYVQEPQTEYELRRDIDGDICTGGFWIFSSATNPAIFGYEVIDTHGHFYVKEV